MTTYVVEQPVRAGWYKRLFAALMDKSSAQYDGMVADRKRALLGKLHGNVLEIGPGTGPNLTYYDHHVHWIGVEPNPAMVPYLEREAVRCGMKLDIRAGAAEQLPVADESMDAVVSTLVLCSVHDQSRTLHEVLRVLKPGGQFVFIEHVAAPRGTSLRRMQHLVRPVWQLASDGCRPDLETWKSIEQAGFERVHIDHFRLDAWLAGPHIAGVAVKKA
jgi:ubiquinone/menaquinone biosynthesis C-methylase UbiE